MASVLTIILNYRTAQMTLRAAQAAANAMTGMTGEITIVDNDSRDGSSDILCDAVQKADWAQDRVVRVLQAPSNGGFGAGNNVGIRAGLSDGTRPDYVYILNSDAFPARDAIQCLLTHLETAPQVGCAGSYIHGEDGTPHTTLFRFPTALGELEGATRFGPITRLLKNAVVPLAIPSTTQRVDWLAGASMMIRQSVLDKIGLFDETFFLYFEETDLLLRAAQAGYETHYLPASQVMHIGSVSTGMQKWQRIPQYWLDSHWHYYSKNHGRGYAVAATLARLTGEGLWSLRRVLQGKPQAGPDKFARDLAMHHAKALFRPLPRRAATVSPSPSTLEVE